MRWLRYDVINRQGKRTLNGLAQSEQSIQISQPYTLFTDARESLIREVFHCHKLVATLMLSSIEALIGDNEHFTVLA